MAKEEICSCGFGGEFAGSGKAGAHPWLWIKVYQDKVENYTEINYSLNIQRDQSYAKTYGTWLWRILDDNGHSGQISLTNIGVGCSTQLMSKTVRYDHKNDGTIDRIYFDADVQAPTTSLGTGTVSGYYEPPTIPRQAKILTAVDFNDEQNPKITLENKGNFPLNLYIEYSRKNHIYDKNIHRSIAAGITEYTFELTENERNLLRQELWDTNKSYVNFVVSTTIGNVSYTSYITKTLSIINANPTFSNFEYSNIDPATINLTNDNYYFLNALSDLKIDISNANKAIAKKGASIVDYLVVWGNKSKSGEFSDTDTVSISGEPLYDQETKIINVYARDSRQNVTLVSKIITDNQWCDYFKPYMYSYNVFRTSGMSKETKLVVNGYFFNSLLKTTQNTITSNYKYRQSGSSEWILGTTPLNLTIENNNFTFEGVIKGDTNEGFNVNESYDIQFNTTDLMGFSATFEQTIGAGIPAIDIYKNNVAFGQMYDESKGGKIQGIEPIGSIKFYKNDFNPATLYGGTWEKIQNVFLFGAGTKALGTTGGEESVSLSKDNLPSIYFELQNRFLMWDSNGSSMFNYGNEQWLDNAGLQFCSIGDNKYKTNTIGSNIAHNNMPPYLAVNIWTRTA